MFKKATVVMLPTNQKAPIFKVGNWNKLYTSCEILSSNPKDFQSDESYQHLYITSDEEIKKGDKELEKGEIYYDAIDNCLRKYGTGNIISIHIYKIIATTDESLKFGEDVPGIIRYKSLPQPTQSFIDKYITEYNKGNIITDIMVEYHYKESFCNGCTKDCIENGCKVPSLKVNPQNNTIIIKKVKDSWTYDEHCTDMQYYMEYCNMNGYVTPQDWLSKYKHY